MAKKKTDDERNPQELTDYSLRGLRNDIADLTARIERLERPPVIVQAALPMVLSRDLD